MSGAAIGGIIAAPPLPMRPDASVDWRGLERYMAEVAAAGPAAIAMNMDASEGPSLDPHERLEVVRVARSAIGGRCPLFSGLSADGTAIAVAHGKELVAAGAEGLIVFPPFPSFLGTPLPAAMVHRHHAAIAAATGVPLIAFRMRWVAPYDSETYARLADIPELIGVKDAMRDTGEMLRTIAILDALPRRIGLLTGNDPVILESLLVGGDGALIGFAGIATERLVALEQAARRRDVARAFALWRPLAPLARFCWRDPVRDYRPRMKELLVMQGRFASAAVRAPQRPVDEAERAALRRLATTAGLLDQPGTATAAE